MKATLRSTQLIRADQKDVLSKLDALQRAIDARGKPEVTTAVIQESGAFFRTDMWALVWKEEDALLPAVRSFLPQEAGIIKQIHLEHAEIRGANDRFQAAVAAYLANPSDGEAMDAVRESGARIASLLRDHIPAEDKWLLAVADANLDEQQDQKMLNVFAMIDADLAWGFENLQEFYP